MSGDSEEVREPGAQTWREWAETHNLKEGGRISEEELAQPPPPEPSPKDYESRDLWVDAQNGWWNACHRYYLSHQPARVEVLPYFGNLVGEAGTLVQLEGNLEKGFGLNAFDGILYTRIYFHEYDVLPEVAPYLRILLATIEKRDHFMFQDSLAGTAFDSGTPTPATQKEQDDMVEFALRILPWFVAVAEGRDPGPKPWRLTYPFFDQVNWEDVKGHTDPIVTDGRQPIFGFPRGKAIQIPDKLMMPTSESARATYAGILSPYGKRAMTSSGSIVPKAGGTDLTFKTAFQDPSSDEEFQSGTLALARSLSTLSLKALACSLLLWAEETGATRHDQFASASIGRILRYSGTRSNSNDDLSRSWYEAWLPLVHSWVEVPHYDYRSAKVQGRRTLLQPNTAEQILISDETTLMWERAPANTSLDRRQTLVRFHPGRWLFDGLHGTTNRQFQQVSSRLLQYDARRDDWLIRIAYYFCPLLRIAANNKSKGVFRSAEGILAGALLPYSRKHSDRVVPKLSDALVRLERDGIFGQIDIYDPGEGVAPLKRIAEYRVRVFDRS